MTEEGIDARTRVLLDSLLRAVGPSSYERPAAEIWRKAAGEFADVRGDALGNSFATVNPGGGPRIALVGHVDEIGLLVKHIDASGVIFVGEIGSWDPAVLVGQRITVLTAAGPVPGVMGKAARHLLSEEERKRVPLVHDLWIDIGARDEEDAASAVQIGDPDRDGGGADRVARSAPRLARARQPPRRARGARGRATRRSRGRPQRRGHRRRVGARGDLVRGRAHGGLRRRARHRDHARRARTPTTTRTATRRG